MSFKDFLKDQLNTTPVAHLRKGSSGSDLLKSMVDPHEWVLKQPKWYDKTRDAQTGKVKHWKQGGKVEMAAGGATNCRGMGCAVRGGKFRSR